MTHRRQHLCFKTSSEKLSKLLDPEGLPKGASAEARARYLRLRNEITEAIRQKFREKPGSDDWKVADKKEKEAKDRLRELERTDAPEVAKQRNEADRLGVAAAESRQALGREEEALRNAVRQRCPEIDYYGRLRQLRADPFVWIY